MVTLGRAVLVVMGLIPTFVHSATTTYTCSFAAEATPKGLSKGVKPLELRYIIDTVTKKAYLLGNAGSSEVNVVPNADGVSFIEVTGSGNVMVTAISDSGDAVHSRNGIMFKELVPSQYYGKCTRR